MHKVSLTAAKAMTYGTRRLRAGDTFEATRQDARVLTAVGMASETQQVSAPAPTPKPVIPPIVDTELAELRHQYEVKTGRKPDSRWRVARLRAEIEIEV